MFEAPVTAASLNTAPVGQTGQTILPFTRSLAVTSDVSAALARLSGPSDEAEKTP